MTISVASESGLPDDISALSGARYAVWYGMIESEEVFWEAVNCPEKAKILNKRITRTWRNTTRGTYDRQKFIDKNGKQPQLLPSADTRVGGRRSPHPIVAEAIEDAGSSIVFMSGVRNVRTFTRNKNELRDREKCQVCEDENTEFTTEHLTQCQDKTIIKIREQLQSQMTKLGEERSMKEIENILNMQTEQTFTKKSRKNHGKIWMQISHTQRCILRMAAKRECENEQKKKNVNNMELQNVIDSIGEPEEEMRSFIRPQETNKIMAIERMRTRSQTKAAEKMRIAELNEKAKIAEMNENAIKPRRSARIANRRNMER